MHHICWLIEVAEYGWEKRDVPPYSPCAALDHLLYLLIHKHFLFLLLRFSVSSFSFAYYMFEIIHLFILQLSFQHIIALFLCIFMSFDINCQYFFADSMILTCGCTEIFEIICYFLSFTRLEGHNFCKVFMAFLILCSITFQQSPIFSLSLSFPFKIRDGLKLCMEFCPLCFFYSEHMFGNEVMDTATPNK